MLGVLSVLDDREEVKTEIYDSLQDYFSNVETQQLGEIAVVHSNICSLRKKFEHKLVYLKQSIENLDIRGENSRWPNVTYGC